MPSSNLRYAQGPRSAASVSIATPNPTLSAESDIARPAADPRVDGANAKQHPVGARSVQTILAGSSKSAGRGCGKTSQTTASKRRSDHLQQTGFISGADSDRVQYEWNAAASAEAAAQKRLEETKVEHDAVADGVFIGDSYNDAPSSIQRETELKMKKGELDAQLAGVRAQITHITDQISAEEARFRLRSEATVALPSIGRVWEMLVGPGEFVNKGQDLMRVLDCSASDCQRQCRREGLQPSRGWKPRDVSAATRRQNLSWDRHQFDGRRWSAGEFRHRADQSTQEPLLRDDRHG